MPISLSGNHDTISGKIHNINIDKTIIIINGNDPFKIVDKLTSGVIPLIIYRFNPTGGVIKPISIFIVNTIANQYGSKPNVVITGNNIAEVITITATGGKRKQQPGKTP